MTNNNIDTVGYKENTRQRILALKANGVSLSFFAFATNINKSTLYTLTQDNPKSISTEKLDRLAVICSQLERILEQGKED